MVNEIKKEFDVILQEYKSQTDKEGKLTGKIYVLLSNILYNFWFQYDDDDDFNYDCGGDYDYYH